MSIIRGTNYIVNGRVWPFLSLIVPFWQKNEGNISYCAKAFGLVLGDVANV